jgi:hypothetical protein
VASFQDQEATTPTSMANVTPLDSGSNQTRVIVDAVKASVATLEGDVKAIRDYRYTDLLLHIGAFAGGIIIVVTMMVTAYFRLDDKITALSTSNTRIETKLEDLLARIPPVAAPVPRRP